MVTGGSGGLEVTPLFHGQTDTPYYYLGLALLLGSLGIMLFLVTSRWGLFFRAIRENEDAAAASGVKVVRFRILAFAITSSLQAPPTDRPLMFQIPGGASECLRPRDTIRYVHHLPGRHQRDAPGLQLRLN